MRPWALAMAGDGIRLSLWGAEGPTAGLELLCSLWLQAGQHSKEGIA